MICRTEPTPSAWSCVTAPAIPTGNSRPSSLPASHRWSSVKLEAGDYHRGQTINLKASASQSTRTLVVRLEGALPVALNWDARAKANAGQIVIPEQIVPGTYKLAVTAEDIAHNIGTQEVQIEILP